jgi:hypothetical protein
MSAQNGGNRQYRLTDEEFQMIQDVRAERIRAGNAQGGLTSGETRRGVFDDGVGPKQRYKQRQAGIIPPAEATAGETVKDAFAKHRGVAGMATDDIHEGDLRADTVVEVTSNKVGVISDLHWPFHALYRDDAGHVYGPYLTALEYLKAQGIGTLVINGDAMDCYNISTHERIESKRDFVWELDIARNMVAHLRRYFGDAVRIIYREGNHEERWQRYIAKNADQLKGMDEVQLPALIRLRDHGIEWVGERSKLTVGKLWIDHGHEWFGSGGVNPARNYRMKAQDNILVGHVHKTTFDMHKRPLDGSVFAGWSMGCLCDLNPHYAPRNHWNHGVVLVELDGSGEFSVHNRILVNNRVR